MKAIEYTLELEAPVIISTNSSDENTIQTKDYIPGYVILGALAKDYQERAKTDVEDDIRFGRWFLSGQVRFFNAYITDEKGEATFPAPLTVHKVKDLEKYFFFPNMSAQEKESYKNTKSHGRYLSRQGDVFVNHKVKMGNHFHINTKLKEDNPEAEGGIFHYQFIEPGQVFKGRIYGDETDLDELLDFYSNTEIVYLGRSKNTEYGRVRLALKLTETDLTQEFEENEVTFFLKSPAILKNKFGYDAPNKKTLEDELGFEVHSPFLRTVEIENFKGVWGIKRPRTKALAIGSSFTVKIPAGSEREISELLQNGIGYRRNEGFGEIDAISLKTSEIKYQEFPGREIAEVKDPPKSFKPFLKKIGENHLREKIESQVLAEAGAFDRRPTNSLLSKIEMMMKTADSLEAFKNSLNNLRSTAKQKLEKCRNNNSTLMNTIKKGLNLRYDQNEKAFFKDIEEEAGKFEYDQLYVSGLMRRLRKLNKEKAEEGAK